MAWSDVNQPRFATAQPSPITALVICGLDRDRFGYEERLALSNVGP